MMLRFGVLLCFKKIDIHTARDSQNGFDNSGQALGFQWTSALSREFVDQLTFQHWPIREARWMGHFDHGTATYPKINHANIRHSLNVIAAIADRYAGHPAIVGLEPLNEPWAFCPIDVLKVRVFAFFFLNKSTRHGLDEPLLSLAPCFFFLILTRFYSAFIGKVI
jgi:hypothetical protein